MTAKAAEHMPAASAVYILNDSGPAEIVEKRAMLLLQLLALSELLSFIVFKKLS